MQFGIVDSFTNSLYVFLSQSVVFLAQLILAYLIWVVGKTFIDWGVKLIDKTEIKILRADDKLRDLVKKIFVPVAKILLFLVILDTFGIGSSVIQAILNGMTFTIAIALGLAFGKALEPEARNAVERIKSSFNWEV